jgi:hypothetical protein
MVHPEYRILREGESPVPSDALTPVYPTTEGVQQGRLRSLTGQALQLMQSAPPEELLPPEICRELKMPSLAEALRYLHRPPPDADVIGIESGRHPCRIRLAFEELLAHYLSLRDLRILASREAAQKLRIARLEPRHPSGSRPCVGSHGLNTAIRFGICSRCQASMPSAWGWTRRSGFSTAMPTIRSPSCSSSNT